MLSFDMNTLIIGGRQVTENSNTLIIAEAGINHDGKFDQALKLIDIAKEAGADVVKFQLFKAQKMYTQKAGDYKAANGIVKPINTILKEAEMPESWVTLLMEYCKKVNIGFLCTVCDEEGGKILNDAGVDAFKIASSGITHIPLIRSVASFNKTMVCSNAAAYISDIDLAVRTIQAQNNNKIAILHCLYRYPTPLSECNLNFIKTLKSAYPSCLIGYSDHTTDPVKAPVTAVILGAKIIEKHFTLDKKLPGADHSFSLSPDELKIMCNAIRRIENLNETEKSKYICKEALGTSGRILSKEELELRKFGYRCIFAIKDIKKGDVINKQNSEVLRPGNAMRGIEPVMYDYIIENRIRATTDIKQGDPIKWDNLLSK